MNEILGISVHELKDGLSKNDIILIDVREPSEYNVGHIKSSVNIPLTALLNEIDRIDFVSGKKIVMQCRIGARSMNACIKLQSEGYDSDFWNLEGGINAWAAAGYEIQK
jgi:rhodanese-related sulfurtransferase